MENRFAGAHNQGERRRRRLANDEAEVAEGLDSAILAEFASETVLNVGQVASAETLGIVSRLVSRHLWKHVVFLFVSGSLLTGLLWQSLSGSTTNQPHFLADSRSSNSLAGLMLLLTGQLCFLIGWLREQSVIDFRGRYRWWHWLATAMVGLSALLITNTLYVVPNGLASLVEPLTGPIVSARPALVMVPCLAFCLIVLSRIIPDMSRCLASQSLFVAAVLAGVVQQMLVFGSSSNSISPVTMNAVVVVAAFFVFASALLHCRFVAYICNDPPVHAVRNVSRTADRALEETMTIVSDPPEPAADSTSPREAKADSKSTTKRTSARRKSTKKTRSRKRKAA